VANIVQKIRSSGIEFPEYEPFSPMDEIIVAIFDSLTDNKKRVYFNENGFVNEYLFISEGEIDGSKTKSNVTSIPFWESIVISETEKLQLRKDFIGDIIMRSVGASMDDFGKILLSYYDEDDINSWPMSRWYDVIEQMQKSNVSNENSGIAETIKQSNLVFEPNVLLKSEKSIKLLQDFLLDNFNFPIKKDEDGVYLPLVYGEKTSELENILRASQNAEQTSMSVENLRFRESTNLDLIEKLDEIHFRLNSIKENEKILEKKLHILHKTLNSANSSDRQKRHIRNRIDTILDEKSVLFKNREKTNQELHDFVDLHIDDLDIPMGLSTI
jgi:hypothetical protein